jgi:glutathione S-transferase
MNDSHEPLREGLLAQWEPSRSKLALYREETAKMLAQNEKTLNRQKWYAGGIWTFVVLMGTLFLYLGGNRVEILKEIKGLELRVMELQEQLRAEKV